MSKITKVLLTLAMTMAMVFSSLSSSSVTAYAATYSYNEGTLSVQDGVTTFVTGGKTYQLTRRLVCKDAGMDKNGTIYMIWMNGALYWWSSKYELNSSYIAVHKLCENATQFVVDSNNYVTEIGTSNASGNQAILTDDQVKQALNQSTKQTTNTSNTNTSTTIPNTTPTTTTTTGYTSSVSINGNQIIYTVNGKSYDLTVAGKQVKKVEIDNGNIYILYNDGELVAWSSSLQGNDPFVYLQKVATGVTEFVYDSRNFVIGYKDAAGSHFLWTTDDFKKSISSSTVTTTPVTVTTVPTSTSVVNSSTVTSTNTNTTSTSTTSKKKTTYRVVKSGKYIKLQTNEGRTIRYAKLSSKGNLTYQGNTFNKVQRAGFTKYGHYLIFRKKSTGAIYKVDINTNEISCIAKKSVRLQANADGLITSYLYKADGMVLKKMIRK